MAEMKILYEDRSVLVVWKPAGMAVESANVTEADLVSRLRLRLREQGRSGDVFPVHRIDQPVEGIVLFAKNPKAAAALSEQQRAGRIERRYRALVGGTIPGEEGTLVDWLEKEPGTNRTRVVPEPKEKRKGRGAPKRSELSWRRVGDRTLEITLKTGRHHQIRAQLAHAGMPIAGDRKYGAAETAPPLPRGGIALCAAELTFFHPVTGKTMHQTVRPSWEKQEKE